MKRLLALLLCVLAIASFTSCSNSTESPADAAVTYTPAVLDGQTYRSTFLGLTATLPSHFTAHTTEQLEELNGFSLDTATDSFKDGAVKAQIIYDLYAANNNGDSIDIQLENCEVSALDVSTAAEYAVLVSDEYAKTLESIGYQNVTVTVTEHDFAGQAYPAIRASAAIGQFTLHQKVVFKKVGPYVARITVGSFTESTVDNLLACFSAL